MIDDCGLWIDDWGLRIAWCVLGLRFGLSGHGFRVVWGFCFVKFGLVCGVVMGLR